MSIAENRRDEHRWQALVDRRPDAGNFFYGVSTTNVFCRPNCPSRLPRRENVVFFDSAAAAIRAGFRPCKRCQPDGPGVETEISSRISAACRLLDLTEQRLSLPELARAAGFSPFHFHRLFKRQLGVTPRQYQNRRQLGRFKNKLRQSDNVLDAIYDAGFGSPSRAYDQAARKLGMSPAQYRKGGAGTDIVFGIQRTKLGLALIAATGRGVCAIDFADTPAELRCRLESEFAAATLREDRASVRDYFARLSEYLSTPSSGLTVPLDLHGTMLQCRVWEALQKVAPGQTITYQELSRRVGKPKAIRAVASACAANQVALAIPCHRAVRSDGGLGGYRWGLARKRRLLDAEAKIAPKGDFAK